MLKANGGNVTRTARELGVAPSTLTGWRDAPDRAAPTEVRDQKEDDLEDIYRREIRSIFGALGTKRGEASFRDLVLAAAVFTDKLLLLIGKPNQHVKQSGFADLNSALDLLRQGYRDTGDPQ